MSNIRLFINGSEVAHSSFFFPGGEVQVRVPSGDDIALVKEIVIGANITDSSGLMELFMVTDAIRREHSGCEIKLTIPYLPYARQDRVCVRGEAIGVAVMAKLINAQNYSSVQIWDPHSDVALPLINNSHAVGQHTLIERMIEEGVIPDRVRNSLIVAPDAGAAKKAREVAKLLASPGVVSAEKIREPMTGAIIDTSVSLPRDFRTNKDFLIVDDICDGGRTFIELAKKLRPLTSGRIELYVTHGIFSAGFDVFNGVIDHIYTANPLLNKDCFKNPIVSTWS
jgi:ribose-phosphate pyrophosphokinase